MRILRVYQRLVPALGPIIEPTRACVDWT